MAATEAVKFSELDTYLRGKYLVQKQEIDQIEALLAEVLPIFHAFWNEDIHGWPYTVAADTRAPVNTQYSQSTNAMILVLLASLLNGGNASLAPVVHGATRAKLRQALAERDLELEPILEAASIETWARLIDGEASRSSTFGLNDPFTLTWIAELFRIRPPNDTQQSGRVKSQLEAGVRDVLKRCYPDRGPSPDWKALLKWTNDESGGRLICLAHPFTILRTLQLKLALAPELQEYPSAVHWDNCFREYFEGLVHLHLSYKMIPDSRFDPAELVFALEGALLLQPGALDEGTIERVFSVLTERQHTGDPYWRPLTPFVSTEQGMVLFPVSVEVANSLLRTCRRLDVARPHDSYFSRHVGLFERYAQWLRARITRGSNDIGRYTGWHSEHVGDRSLIHLWETSQVLVFLLEYVSMLRGNVSSTALVASRLHKAAPSAASLTKRQEEWAGFATREPASRRPAYEELDKHYIKPRLEERGDPLFSLLLYGPPGTGKTTIAKEMAKALDWPLIVITVNDFLAGGAAEVEARAKSIFEALALQQDAVILFDEIDHFLLHRGSRLYGGQQGTIFQFLTPGMLTKIQHLRDSAKSIFIIATNYGHRIDAAIKRPGRIDRQLLVLPPDLARRKALLPSRLAKAFATSSEDKGVSPEFDPEIIERFACLTALWSWKEINQLAEDTAKSPKSKWAESLAREFKKLRNSLSISLSAYFRECARNEKDDPDRKPIEELCWLMYLRSEAAQPSRCDVLEKLARDREADKDSLNDVIKELWDGPDDQRSTLVENITAWMKE